MDSGVSKGMWYGAVYEFVLPTLQGALFALAVGLVYFIEHENGRRQ